MNVTELLAQGTAALAGCVEQPAQEAELLLAHSMARPRSWLRGFAEKSVELDQQTTFNRLVQRRAHGEPFAYVVGQREFWSLTLEVTPAVLVPRPETERLVELALERIPLDQAVNVADLGTGSGAIALALARERPQARIVATDRDGNALAVAERNAKRLVLNSITFSQGDWYAALPVEQRFDLIVSNPPYIPPGDPHLRALAREPQAALVAMSNGLAALRTLAQGAPARLATGGWLLMEHGLAQGDAVRKLLQQAGFSNVQTWNDLGDRPRVSGGQKAA